MEAQSASIKIPDKERIIQHDFSDASSLFVDKKYRENKIYPKHVHSNIEIGIIISGTGRLCYDNTWYPIRKGDGYFLESRVPHTHQPDEGCHLENLFAHIKYQTIEALAPNDNYVNIIRPFLSLKLGAVSPVLHNAKVLYSSLIQAKEAFDSDDPFGYVVAWNCVCRTFVEICRYALKSNNQSVATSLMIKHDVLDRVLRFINENYLANLTLQDIANHAGVSVSGLSSLFQSFVHISPIAYRNKLRINLSMEKLCLTTKSIEEIAYECSFESISNFRRQFRRFTGHNPSDIRRSIAT